MKVCFQWPVELRTRRGLDPSQANVHVFYQGPVANVIQKRCFERL